jgi:peptide/nickel transport system substrate-binding protein
MKVGQLIHRASAGRILLAALVMLFPLYAGPAGAAPEPGTITIVLDTEPDMLDASGTVHSLNGRVVTKNITESLTELNPDDGRIVPKLAQSWKQVDANTWQFFLQKGVKFHDGQDFNAVACVFNITRLYDKKLGHKTKEKFFSQFTMTGKALDNYTLEIKTDKVQPLLPTLMATFQLCSPNTPVDKLTRTPVGTGPYKFVKWDAGMQIVVERFEGYWGKKPAVEKAIYVWRTESSVRASMVLIGEADLAPTIAIQDAKRPDMDYSYLNAETSFIRIGGEWEPPLNDRRVRMALNLAVDRDSIRGSILSKDVVPAAQLIGPSVFGHNPDLKPWPYDPNKAKQLLDEARKDGVPVDKEISITARETQYPGSAEVMEAVATMFRNVGFNVKLRMLDAGVLRRYQFKPFPKDLGPYLWANQHGNAIDAEFSSYYYECNGSASSVCDKKLEDMIEKAKAKTGEERKNLWRAMLKYTHEEVIPNIPLFHMVGYSRIGPRISYKPAGAANDEIPLARITFKR